MIQNCTFLSNLPPLASFLNSLIDLNEIIDLNAYASTIEFKLNQISITKQEVLHFYQHCDQQDFIRMHSSRNWTDEEWKVLIWITLQYCHIQQKTHDLLQNKDWPIIAEIVSFKDYQNCNYKWQCHLKNLPQNKAWTTEEDRLLFQIMTEDNNVKWFEVQYEMFVKSDCSYFRKAKQYRERWNNYLNPSVNRGIWTEVDDRLLLTLALAEGLRWSNISKKMRNRTENQVKNRFKSLLNKEKKIQQINDIQSQRDLKFEIRHGIDAQSEQLIRSILSRLKPLQKNQQQQLFQEQQLLFQEQQQQQQQQQQQLLLQQQQQQQLIQQEAGIQQQSLTAQQINLFPQQITNENLQQLPPNLINSFIQPQPAFNPMMLQTNPFFYQQMPQLPLGCYPSYMNPNFQGFSMFHNQFQGPQQFAQDQQQQCQQLVDNIKEEEGSSDKSIQAQEPKLYKNICMSQQISARSSANGSSSSVNSIEQIKTNFQNLNIDSEAGSPEILEKNRKHKRSQSGANFDVSNVGKVKTKRSRFYYQSND